MQTEVIGTLLVVQVRIRRVWEQRVSIARFLATGLFGAVLNVGLFLAFSHGLGLDYRIAVVLAFALSYLFSFVSHRTWTFSATGGHAGHQGARFVVVSAVSIALALAVTVLGVEVFGLPKYGAEIVAAVLTAPVSFLMHRRYTFVVRPAVSRSMAPLPATLESTG